MKSFISRFFLAAIPIVLTWLMGSICFFKYVEDWEWIVAIFYAVNLFMGVGFGFPVVRRFHSKWFAVVHAAVGSTFVCGILMVAFTSVVMSGGKHRTWTLWRRRVLVTLACASYVVMGTYFALIPGNVMSGEARARLEQSAYDGHVLDDALTEKAYMRISFIDAMLFAATSMSSVAQLSPVPRSPQLLFTSFYILFGCPLWAGTTGMLGAFLFHHYQRVHKRRRARRHVDEMNAKAISEMIQLREMREGRRRGDGGFAAPDYGSYLEYELTQLGVVDRKLVKLLRERFSSIEHFGQNGLTSSSIEIANARLASSSDEDDEDDDGSLAPLLRHRRRHDRNGEESTSSPNAYTMSSISKLVVDMKRKSTMAQASALIHHGVDDEEDDSRLLWDVSPSL